MLASSTVFRALGEKPESIESRQEKGKNKEIHLAKGTTSVIPSSTKATIIKGQVQQEEQKKNE